MTVVTVSVRNVLEVAVMVIAYGVGAGAANRLGVPPVVTALGMWLFIWWLLGALPLVKVTRL